MRIKAEELKTQLVPGDIILYRGSSFLAKAILFFMENYRKARKIPKRILFNHTATVVKYKDILYVAEAMEKGIQIVPFTSSYGKKLNRIKVIRPKKAYSKTERNKISDVAIGYSFNPTRYDFFNFFHQIKMIRTLKKRDQKEWTGPVGNKAKDRLYCSEASATWANEVRINTFKSPWAANPLDVDINKYYVEIYNGVEKAR